MTINTPLSTTGKLPGNGVSTQFSFSPFIIFEDSDLIVTKVAANGTETVLTEGTGAANYSVQLVTAFPSTGQITYPATGGTVLANGEFIVIQRVMPITQGTDLENQGGYYPEVVEEALDRLTMICSQLQEQLNRAVLTTVGSTDTPATLMATLVAAAASAQAAAAICTAALTSLSLIQATTAALGIAKLSSTAQAQALTDDLTIMTPLKVGTALALKKESLVLSVTAEAAVLTAGTNKLRFRMPYAFVVTGVRASLNVAQTSGSVVTVDINESGVSIISTKLTFDNTERTTVTAAVPPVISDANLADDAEISIDIDQVGDGTAQGLKVTLIGHQ